MCVFKKIYRFLSILYVLSIFFSATKCYGRQNNVSSRLKRQDSPWVWGMEESTTKPITKNSKSGESTESPVTTNSELPVNTSTFLLVVKGTKVPVTTNIHSNETSNETNPCDPIDEPAKPNFESPGVRVSEAKCFDYIWQIKKREDDSKKTLACLAYNKKHFGPLGDIFAIGGRDTTPGEFPHMGAIGWKAIFGTWIFKCGSTLISSKFILTAAHCSKAPARDTTVADLVPKIVRLGDKNIADTPVNNVPPKDVSIFKIIVHPQYSSPKKYNDIALIELEEDVTFTSFIQPACLWSKFDTSSLGIEAIVTGWGVVETATLTTSLELKAAVVDIIDTKQCDELMRPLCNRLWCGVEDTQLCAGKLAGGVDACRGDSGGPLQVQIRLPITSQGKIYYVIGVTSFGIECGRVNTPGMYTRVSAYIDWIENIVWPR